MVATKNLFGLEFAELTIKQCTEFLLQYPKKKNGLLQIITANSAIIVSIQKDDKLKKISNKENTFTL